MQVLALATNFLAGIILNMFAMQGYTGHRRALSGLAYGLELSKPYGIALNFRQEGDKRKLI